MEIPLSQTHVTEGPEKALLLIFKFLLKKVLIRPPLLLDRQRRIKEE